MTQLSLKKTNGILLIVFVFLALLLTSDSVFADGRIWDVKYTLYVENNTEVDNITIINDLYPGWYFTAVNYGTSAKIIEAAQTGGECGSFRSYKEGRNSYVECTYDESRFVRGDFVEFRILADCDCTEKWGIDLFVYPVNFKIYEGDSGSVEETVYVPAGYYLFNTSIKSAVAEEMPEGLKVTFKEEFTNKSLSDIYGTLFLQLRKKLDFANIKKIESEKFTLLYPAGMEEEAQAIAEDAKRALPHMESYSGQDLSNLTIRIHKDTSFIDGYSGRANPLTREVNLTTETYNGTLYHELCHIAEGPLDFPQWFSEGQAMHCELGLYNLFGRFDEAKRLKGEAFNESQLKAAVDLQRWVPSSDYNVNQTQTDKGYGQAYILMRDILGVVNMTEFYAKAREDFKGYKYELPTDAVVCKMNEVAKSDIIKTFEKYGFRIAPCSEKTYEFLKEAKPGPLAIAIGIAIIGFVFIGLPVLVGFGVWKLWKGRKITFFWRGLQGNLFLLFLFY